VSDKGFSLHEAMMDFEKLDEAVRVTAQYEAHEEGVNIQVILRKWLRNQSELSGRVPQIVIRYRNLTNRQMPRRRVLLDQPVRSRSLY
jgi:hypothetical protein